MLLPFAMPSAVHRSAALSKYVWKPTLGCRAVENGEQNETSAAEARRKRRKNKGEKKRAAAAQAETEAGELQHSSAGAASAHTAAVPSDWPGGPQGESVYQAWRPSSVQGGPSRN